MFERSNNMAQIKSQKKRILTNEKARVKNAAAKSAMRTAIKKVKKACDEKDLAAAKASLPIAISLIDKSVSDGVQKLNTANRQKCSLNRLVNSLEA